MFREVIDCSVPPTDPDHREIVEVPPEEQAEIAAANVTPL